MSQIPKTAVVASLFACVLYLVPRDAAPDHVCALSGRLEAQASRSARIFEREQGGVLAGASAAHVRRVGGALVDRIDEPGLHCRFRILNSSGKNAYSLSCGSVYLTRGLYADLENEEILAAVIAHEIAHVAAQDGKHPCSTRGCQLRKELQADARAVRYLQKAGFEPAALLSVIKLLRHEQPSGWADRRIAALGRLLAPPTSPERHETPDPEKNVQSRELAANRRRLPGIQ